MSRYQSKTNIRRFVGFLLALSLSTTIITLYAMLLFWVAMPMKANAGINRDRVSPAMHAEFLKEYRNIKG